jgi:DNA-binding transcriptional regulator YiaG
MNSYQYTECGLDFVYLANGYQEHKTKYGEGVSISASDTLDAQIALTLISSTARLSGQCVRFLRTLMNMTQKELADELGTRRVSVARWELKPDTPIPPASDRVLRFVVSRELFSNHATQDLTTLLSEISDDPLSELHMVFQSKTEPNPSESDHANNDDEEGEWSGERAAAR